MPLAPSTASRPLPLFLTVRPVSRRGPSAPLSFPERACPLLHLPGRPHRVCILPCSVRVAVYRGGEGTTHGHASPKLPIPQSTLLPYASAGFLARYRSVSARHSGAPRRSLGVRTLGRSRQRISHALPAVPQIAHGPGASPHHAEPSSMAFGMPAGVISALIGTHPPGPHSPSMYPPSASPGASREPSPSSRSFPSATCRRAPCSAIDDQLPARRAWGHRSFSPSSRGRTRASAGCAPFFSHHVIAPSDTTVPIWPSRRLRSRTVR